MASSVNKVILIGNCADAPKMRNDGKIATLRIATSDSWRDKQSGERREKTEWHNIVIFNEQLAKVAQQYVKKGSKIYIEGQLQTRKYQDDSGGDRYTTEVVLQNYNGQLTLLDGNKNEGGGRSDEDRPSNGGAKQRNDEWADRGGGKSKPASSGAPAKSFTDDLDDEVPF
jgi:single-strand DNA-binding protein